MYLMTPLGETGTWLLWVVHRAQTTKRLLCVSKALVPSHKFAFMEMSAESVFSLSFM